jgi:hypothetical protein
MSTSSGSGRQAAVDGDPGVAVRSPNLADGRLA